MAVAPKRHVSIRLDEVFYSHLKSKPNASRYIQSLIKQDYQMEQKEPLYQAIMERMLTDEQILAQLAAKLNRAGPVVRTVDAGVSIVEGDWGA